MLLVVVPNFFSIRWDPETTRKNSWRIYSISLIKLSSHFLFAQKLTMVDMVIYKNHSDRWICLFCFSRIICKEKLRFWIISVCLILVVFAKMIKRKLSETIVWNDAENKQGRNLCRNLIVFSSAKWLARKYLTICLFADWEKQRVARLAAQRGVDAPACSMTRAKRRK